MESIKKQHTHLSEVLAFKCPLCGNILAQDTYNQTINELKNKTDQMHQIDMENQKNDYENKIKFMNEKREQELDDLKNFYSNQNQSMIKEIERSSNYQLNELKQNYENSIKTLKEQLEDSKIKDERRLNEIIKSKDVLLNELRENQVELKRRSIEEGRRMASQDLQVLQKEITQKNIQLDRLKNDLEKLKNETTSTQSELKGEAGELDLYLILQKAFPDDNFERQKRGSSSGDIIQHIKTNSCSVEMPIVFDNKESSRISKSDLEKAKKYRKIHKTNYVIIVTANLTSKECYSNIIAEKDEILFVHPSVIVEFVRQVRKFLIDLSKEKISQKDRNSKEAKLFNFIKSHDFARRLSNVYDIYKKNKEQQVKEEKEHQTNWKTRDTINEQLREIYVEISSQITSIFQSNSFNNI